MEISEQVERFKDFVGAYYKIKLHEAVQSGKRSIVCDFALLSEFDVELAEELLSDPENLIRAAELSLESFDLPKEVLNFRVRFTNLPKSQTVRISDVREKDLNKFVCIEGIIRQSSDVRPQVVHAKFECPNCGNVHSIIQLEERFREPTRCSCGRRNRFRLISKILVDAQHLLIEEDPEVLIGGEQPKRLTIFLKEDLVEPRMEKRTTPGAKIAVYGIIKETPVFLRSGQQSTRYLLAMDTNYIEPREESYDDIDISREEEEEILNLASDPDVYKRLVKSIAPSIYGHEDIKEALVLQLMGGVKKERKDGTVTRGDMHVLLVGDPGAAKSTLLMYMAKAAPKARYVAGKGATAAGLCVAPDSLILTNPGKIYDIKSLVEEKLDNNYKHYNKDILQAKDPLSDKKIFTLDENLKIKPSKISQFWKIKAPKDLVKISTQSGKSIITTPNTKLYTLSDGVPYWREAEMFKVGGYLAASRELRFKNENKQLLINLLKSNPIVCGVKKHVKEIIKILCLKNKLNKRELAKFLKINEDKLYYNWINENARGNINLRDLIQLADKSGYSIENIAKNATFSLRHGHRIKLPVYLNKDVLYFAGLITSDGDLCRTNNTVTIRFSNNSEELQHRFVSLSKSLFCVRTNISSERSIKRAESRRFNSKLVFEILNSLGIPPSPKSHKIDMSNILLNLPNDYLASFIRGYFDGDGGPVERNNGSSYIECTTTSEIFAKKLQLVLLRFGIYSRLSTREPIVNERIYSKHKRYILKIYGKENLVNFQKHICFNLKYKRNKLNHIINKIKDHNTNTDVIPNINNIFKKLRNNEKLTSREMFGYKNSSYFSGRFNVSKNNLKRILSRLKVNNLYNLDLLANSDIFWERITKVEYVKPNYDYVYDLTVEDSHNFIVNGFVVHNTASVVRDEVLKGWALEAGSIVLANGGFLMLDELDKMDETDRAAMHEALAQQRVTISKANIHATLKAETTVLAAANPKFGRFDPFKTIAMQIDLPPTLINRFDLIFPVMDIPNRENDSRIAGHVLNLQRDDIGSEPEIPIKLMKKYVAYARQKVKPILSDAALNEIKDFYVNLRNKDVRGEGERKPIPISARQLEALVRLAEGSARVRLSKNVTRDDAKRSIKLLKHCLMQVGFDYETQTFDIDMINTGISTNERTKMGIMEDIRNIINYLCKEEKSTDINEIYKIAKEKNIEKDKVDEAIERLKQKGDIFERKQGEIHKL